MKKRVQVKRPARRIRHRLETETVEKMHRNYALVQPHLKLIDSIVRRFDGIHHDPQAARQEIIHKLLLSNISGNRDPKPFIAKTATNICFNLGRKRRRWFSFESVKERPELIVDAHMTPVEAAIAREEAERTHATLNSALGKLNSVDRTVFLLSAFDYPQAEIAGILNLPLNTVKVKYHRVRKALREVLDGKPRKTLSRVKK